MVLCGVLVHSDRVADIVRTEAQRAGITARVLVTDMDTVLDNAHLLLREGCEVLICHGHCRHAVFAAFSTVTVFLERSDLDVIVALRAARERSREVMFTAHDTEIWDIPFLEDLLDMRIHLVRYRDQGEMRNRMATLFGQGVRVAVGGGITAHIMAGFGGETVLDEPREVNMRSAFARAVALAAGNRRDADYREHLTGILCHVREGVVCVTEQGEPLYCNDQARDLLHAPNDASLARYYPTLFLDEVLRTREARTDVLVSVREKRLLVSTFPVARQSGGQGAVSFIQDIGRVRSITRTISDEMYARGFTARYDIGRIKGASEAVRLLKEKIRRYAATDSTILITGETGTGKELAAHALHNESTRRNRAFVGVNCAALPETLLESELFGYDEGAFTGARRGGKEGLFELAHKGTLYLDEIGDISPSLQLRLLRVLETREIMRVGGDRLVQVDVRVICSTHQPLAALVQTGRFRMDLYYRLAGLRLAMPPLRERPEDIPLLLTDLIAAYNLPQTVISPAMHAALARRNWPGNVRELFALVGAYLALLTMPSPDPDLFADILTTHEPLDAPEPTEPASAFHGTLKERLAAFRRQTAMQALVQTGNDRVRAARQLGISLSTLHRVLATR